MGLIEILTAQQAMKPESKPYNEWQKLLLDMQVYLRWALAGVIDCLFLAFWLYLQSRFNALTSGYRLSGIDEMQYAVLQIAFSVSTLAPIIIFLAKDVVVMIIQAYKIIRAEVKRPGGES